jgi:hypothetical protein
LKERGELDLRDCSRYEYGKIEILLMNGANATGASFLQLS